jgi:hypothetical protein
MKTAAAELAKLRAEREALKKREVFILSREETSKKGTIEDMHLIIDRLQGQVKAQEREINRQSHIISGLQGDLKREGTALLDGQQPALRSSPSDESLVKGLERDVATEGTTLLRSTGESDARAALRRSFGNEVRALAKHAAQLDKFLAANGEGPAEPLARSVAAEAEHLGRSLGMPRTPRGARAPHGAKAPAALPDLAAIPAAQIDEGVPEVKDELTPLSESLPQPLTEELPPLKDSELSPQALSPPAPEETPRHRPHMQRLRKIQGERPAAAKVGAEANRTTSAKSLPPLPPVPTSTSSSVDAIDGASPVVPGDVVPVQADVPDALDAPDAPAMPDAADAADLGQPEAIPMEAVPNAADAGPDMGTADGLSDALDEDSE